MDFNQQRKVLNNIDEEYKKFGQDVRTGQLSFGRFEYALGIAASVRQAWLCGYNEITLVELGVAGGAGFNTMVKVADYFKERYDMKINVVGFDNPNGMPPTIDYRDHPEIWSPGQFGTTQANVASWNLPDWATYIEGDVRKTIPEFVKTFDNRIAWISLDVDYYSSTVSAFPLFEMPAERYIPAVGLHVDDINTGITYNPWCGEALAINEFNDSHAMRKIEEKNFMWQIHNFHVLHILDHPVRSGAEKPLFPIDYGPF
jgi:hypothetical protein